MLFRIANNLLGMRARTARSQNWVDHQPIDDGLPLVGNDSTPEQHLNGEQQLQRLLDVIKTFPPKCREVFVLSRFHDMSYPDIAVRCLISTKMVEKHMRGRHLELREISLHVHPTAHRRAFVRQGFLRMSTGRTTRREFLATAAALGTAAVWAGTGITSSDVKARERRDLYPEGVASGDPDAHSVMLWTRRPFTTGSQALLRVEVSEDDAFTRIIATATATVFAVSDWTSRVLVGNLKPASVYWYRFIDEQGNASRVGRTITAPADDDARPVKFAFLSCQWICSRYLNTYRRMILDDERAEPTARLDFVLHLGDFAYKKMFYAKDNPNGDFYGPIRELGRFPQGQRLEEEDGLVSHIPVTLKDCRTIYRIYLNDPNLQEARARWPFVCIWDNGEFAWEGGYQTLLFEEGKFFPAQSRKLAANQAWFEYMPARVKKASGPSLERFDPAKVKDAPITRFDAHGMADEPNNRAALASLTGYRALRFGANVDLVITDQWSYRTADVAREPEAQSLLYKSLPRPVMDQDVLAILDAGREHNGGHPPETIRFGDVEIPNFRKHQPAQSLLGAEQKAWFFDRLKRSTARWKIWGSSLAPLAMHVDCQNLDDAVFGKWPTTTYGVIPTRDYSIHFRERAEICAHIRNEGITGLAVVVGDRHSFFAGLLSAALPPERFEPVGVAFVTGAVSSSGPVFSFNRELRADNPLRRLYLGKTGGDGKPAPIVNILTLHGVRSALEYAESGDIEKARALANPELAPHLKFVDLDGNGYSVVRATSDTLECEFGAIPTPLTPDPNPPVRYRIVHRTRLWKAGEALRLEQQIREGDPDLCL